jgi:hypothetical protein
MVTGTDIVHVPYRGTGPQLQDLSAAGSTRPRRHARRSCRTSRAGSCARSRWERRIAFPRCPIRRRPASSSACGLRDDAVVRNHRARGHPARDREKLNARINKALRSSHVTSAMRATTSRSRSGALRISGPSSGRNRIAGRKW